MVFLYRNQRGSRLNKQSDEVIDAVPSPEQEFLQTVMMAAVSEGIPSLPSYLFELNALFSTSPIDLKKATQIIRTDPSLSAQVMRTCSALFGEGAGRGIEQAILLLGAERMRMLVLTASVLQLFGTDMNPAVAQTFWQHSMLTALVAERIARYSDYPEPAHAYLAGLLHDLGVIPLLIAAAQYLKPGSSQVMCWGETPDVERRMTGTDHCEIGACLSVLWKLPVSIIEVVEHHHSPEFAVRDPHLMGIVVTADHFCRLCGIVLGGGRNAPTSSSARAFEQSLHIHLPHLAPRQRAEIQGAVWDEYMRLTELVEFDPCGLPQLAKVDLAQ